MPSALPAISAATRRSALLLSFATFSSMATQRICDAMLPELSKVFSTDMATVAQVVWVFAVVYGVAQLFYGPLGDRLGKFRIITYCTLGCSLSCLGAALANSLDTLVLARMMSAFCAAAIVPLSLAWIGDAVPYARRLETLARVGLGTTLGLVSGQLLGGVMADYVGWRWAFVLLMLLFSVVGCLLYQDFQKQQHALRAETAKPAEPPAFLSQALRVLSDPWARYVLMISCLQGAAGFGVLTLIASHLHQVLGLSLSLSGAIVAMFGLGGVLYMSLARRLVQRLGEIGLARVGSTVLCVSFLALSLTTWWPLTPVICLIGGFGFFMFHNTMQANATQMVATGRGTAMSLFSASLFTGQALGVLLATLLIGWVGSGVVIALGGVVIAGLGLLLARGLRARKRSAPSPAAQP
jgi:YNFM family putative membrane transporter